MNFFDFFVIFVLADFLFEVGVFEGQGVEGGEGGFKFGFVGVFYGEHLGAQVFFHSRQGWGGYLLVNLFFTLGGGFLDEGL